MKRMIWITMFTLSTMIVSAQQYKVTKVLDNGPAESTYNLVVVAEAFTQADMPNFEAACAAMEDAFKYNDLFNSGLIDNINIWAISCPSVDGAISLIANNPGPTDPIQTTEWKNTQFGIHYLNTWRAYFIPDSTIAKARRVAAEHVPFSDNVIILVNAFQGQRISGRASAEDGVCVAGISSNFSSTWEKYILIHETGHSMGGLSDAYSTSAEEGFNKSTVRDPNLIRWSDQLSDPDVSIDSITPGVFIPNKSCLMRNTNAKFFCPVCAKVMTETLSSDEHKKIPNVHRIEVVSEDLTNDIFTFKWDAVPGATAYEAIYQSNAMEQGVWTKTFYIQTVTTNEVTFDLNGTYYQSFRDDVIIRAYNDDFSTFFRPFQVMIPQYWRPSVPFAVPSNITISNETSNSFTVTWDETINSQASEIRLWNSNGEFSEIRTDKNTITFSNLEENGIYSVEIAAINPVDIDANNASPFSQKIVADLSGIPTNVEYIETKNPSIFPNPAQNIITVRNVVELTDYTIYSSVGQQVLFGSLTSSGKVDISTLSSGAYFMTIGESAVKFVVGE